jgi:cytidine deaminase
LNSSDQRLVSVMAAKVLAGKEVEFLALAHELHELIRARGYGTDLLLQDGRNPGLYYDIRTWASREAADRCHADREVHAIWARVDTTMKLSHLIANASLIEASVEAGGERRRRGSDRRRGERRLGDRRARDVVQAGGDRRRGDRRGSADRRSSGRDRRARGSDADRAAALVAAARRARLNAHAPFSSFPVGAALETEDGHVIVGCNVENATYGLTICAERVAMFTAMAQGHRRFRRVAVVADTDAPTPPCGACRQILWELGGDVDIILADLSSQRARYRLSALLPLPFDASLLGGARD